MGNCKQHGADCMRAPPVKHSKSNLESDWMRANPVAKITCCMHCHQTPLSRGVGGVACMRLVSEVKVTTELIEFTNYSFPLMS